MDYRNAEERPHEAGGYISRMGRSTTEITCPFCGTVTTAYLWSLCGCGKRCDGCSAIHKGYGSSFKEKD